MTNEWLHFTNFKVASRGQEMGWRLTRGRVFQNSPEYCRMRELVVKGLSVGERIKKQNSLRGIEIRPFKICPIESIGARWLRKSVWKKQYTNDELALAYLHIGPILKISVPVNRENSERRRNIFRTRVVKNSKRLPLHHPP